MTATYRFSFEPSRDKKVLRRQLQAERQAMVDRHQRSVHLQEVLRVFLLQGAVVSALGSLVGAVLAGVLGLLLGLAVIPLVNRVIMPMVKRPS
jgi:ABC-type nitrate/sulfonate/bicarbonate transport system permease component